MREAAPRAELHAAHTHFTLYDMLLLIRLWERLCVQPLTVITNMVLRAAYVIPEEHWTDQSHNAAPAELFHQIVSDTLAGCQWPWPGQRGGMWCSHHGGRERGGLS